MKCPKCLTNSLIITPIVKYKDIGGWKIIGEEEWCIRRNCEYQYERTTRGI